MFFVIFADVWWIKYLEIRRMSTCGAVSTLILLALMILSSFHSQSSLKTRYPRPKAVVQEKPMVVLTMFTTFKNRTDKYQTYCNTLHNWALFLPQIQPILFTYGTDQNLIKLAKRLGWLVFDVPRLGKNKVPIWKDMYFAAQNHSNSIFYSFFNGDILFDHGLLDTLLIVKEYINQLNKPLIIGQRTNVPLRGRDLWNTSDVTKAAKEGQLFVTGALDYLILAHNQFVWDQVRDVVIGRPGYDNYIVVLALNNNLSIIDATETILALHQTGKDGNTAGEQNKDNRYNHKVLGNFDFSRGGTENAPLCTKRGHGEEKIELWRRPMKQMVKLLKLKCQ